MKKIVCNLKPFDVNQVIYIFHADNQIDTISVKTTDVSKSIVSIANEYAVKQIDLAGAADYVNGIIQQIKQEEFKTYNVNNLEFKMI